MLIAEIGNNHFGDFEMAKELIRVAHNCGADLIKGQAFRASDVKSGSMPPSFYEQCEFEMQEYLDLIDYARELGNDMFYSIFSTGMDAIEIKQKWRKVTGSQTREGNLKLKDDKDNLIVSVPLAAAVPRFKKAIVLHVSDYMTSQPNLWHIEDLTNHIGHQAGYSDHTIGAEACIRAIRTFGVHVIEKHFTLKKRMEFQGVIFRDTVHGSAPIEFTAIARELSK